MNLALTDAVVVLTGGTGGIGSQIVADFLAEGSTVICFIRSSKKKKDLLDKLENEDKAETGKLFFYECNLLDYDEIHAKIRQVVVDHHHIDVLVNCAGSVIESPVALLEKDQIDFLLDVNLKSAIYMCRAVLKPMFSRKSGCIINISSVSAVKKGRGVAVYAAAKAGLDTFSRALSQEVGRKNIRVNCIQPGLVKTNMSVAVRGRVNDKIASDIALGRVGLPGEISKAVLFLASNETSGYMTGATMTIDGGMY